MQRAIIQLTTAQPFSDFFFLFLFFSLLSCERGLVLFSFVFFLVFF